MKSALRGRRTLAVEVSNVSPHGMWLLLDERELFVPFAEFPWFRDGTIGDLTTVERPSGHHLYWPALDVDLDVASLEHPERFPLVDKLPNKRDAASKLQRKGRTNLARPAAAKRGRRGRV